jgi:tetrahydromethanopterin S-methyltransferase subunit H
MLDVVGSTPEAMKKFIEFVADATDVPFLIDGPTPDVKIAGLEYAKEIGVIERAVYNSLIPEYKPEELAKIKEVGLRSSILLAYNVKEFTTNGRIKALRELVKTASQSGIDKPLLDTCVLDVPSLGSACRALFAVKDEIGLPTGCGAHNAVSLWRGLKKKFDERAVKPSLASACVVTVAIGADFVLYGPVEDAPYVFPSIAMINAAYGHAFQIEKGTRPSSTHPIFKVA